MDTHKKIREHISALSDGELSASDLELAFAALHSVDGQQAWNTYHHIGDVLRAQATPDLSAGFAERLAARLSIEAPPVRRPRADEKRVSEDPPALQRGNGSEQRTMDPGAAVVAASKPAIASVS